MVIAILLFVSNNDRGQSVNIEKGLNRIAAAIGWIGTGTAAISVFIGLGSLFGSSSDKTVIFGLAIFIALLCYGAGRLLRWLIEGFTDKDIEALHNGQVRQSSTNEKFRELFATQERKKTSAAYLFFFLAFSIPIIYESRVPDGGINAAYMIGYMLGIGLLILLIGVATTKKRSETRANFLVSLSLVAVVWVSASCFKEWEAHKEFKASARYLANVVNAATPPDSSPTENASVSPPQHEEIANLKVPGHTDSGAAEAAALMNTMAELVKKQAERMTALGKKFDAPDAAIDTVLIPENFVNPARLAESRKRLQKFQSLIAERQRLLDDCFRESEELIKTSHMSEYQRSQVLQGFHKTLRQTKTNYKKLDDSQQATIKASSAILDIAQRGMGVNQIQDGKILFAAQGDLDAYNRNLERVMQLAQEEQAATQAILQAAEAIQENLNKLASGK